MLELKWKCPGRRHPDSDKKPDEDVKEVVVQTPTKVDEQRYKLNFYYYARRPKALLIFYCLAGFHKTSEEFYNKYLVHLLIDTVSSFHLDVCCCCNFICGDSWYGRDFP